MTFSSLVLHDLPHVQISQVLSLCYAIPTSLLPSQDSGLVCFLLTFLSATNSQGQLLSQNLVRQVNDESYSQDFLMLSRRHWGHSLGEIVNGDFD
jgi:hypothetical protein